MVIPPVEPNRVVVESFVAAAEHYALIGSTNDRAKEAATEGGDLPLLIVADSQTGGRGRGTNRWWTGPGSLAMSLLADPAAWGIDARRDAPGLSLAAARAVAETVNARLPKTLRAEVHAPNDVYVAGRKLAGILIEGLASGLMVIGIGLNTNSSTADAPAELRDRAITLRDLLGQIVDPTELLIDLLARLNVALGLVAECVKTPACERRVGSPS